MHRQPAMSPGRTVTDPRPHRLSTVAELYAADRAAAAAGITGLRLMERAGGAVAAAAARRVSPGGSVHVLCGPGNNGGDGLVAARMLRRLGRSVVVAMSGPPDALSGDAAISRDRWGGLVGALDPDLLSDTRPDLVIDALFGAGLTRAVDGAAALLLHRLCAAAVPVLSVDMPSGVRGDTGGVDGVAAQAVETVTFARAKPGHLLLPGRDHVGRLVVADIGIPDACLPADDRLMRNHPDWWLPAIPWRRVAGHKYDAGHLLVVAGAMGGAARLAALGARRCGAGLTTLAAPAARMLAIETDAPGIMTRTITGGRDLSGILEDPRVNAVVVGPGLGQDREAAAVLAAAVSAGRPTIVDADGLALLAAQPLLRQALRRLPAAVMTPHAGEFARIGIDLNIADDKIAAARHAAALFGACVVLKGADTVIAAPDGRAVVNDSAPPELATAGSGDVLAGMIGGLISQGMAAFEAACAATWIHGQAAQGVGHGLLPEDLPGRIPAVLARLRGAGAGLTA